MTTKVKRAFVAHVKKIVKLAIAGDEFSVKTLAAMVLIANG